MKKLLLLALAMAGYVGTLSATDYSIGASEGEWKIIGQMTPNGDDSYSFIINFPENYDNYLFTIFEGNEISSDWSNAYRPNGADNNWGLGDNNTPTMKKGVNDKVLIYPVNSTIARAIRVDFTPSTGACVVTRLIAVASGFNHWSTKTDYLEETSRGSNVYSGSALLEASSEGVDDGFQFVGFYGKTLTYYSYKNDNGEWIDVNQGNATVSKDGVYSLTANFSDYKWVAPELVTVPATISSVGYSTFSSAYPVDFTDVSEVTAYRATQTTDNMVLLTKVSGKVAANTGLVLKGTSTPIPTAISGTSYTRSENLLVASVDQTTVTPGGTDYYYFLAGSSLSDIGFYQLASSSTSGAGKAYLVTAEALASEGKGSGARAAWIFDDETQGISSVEGVQPADVVYDLQGRVARGVKAGLYIKNGKKVVLK